MLQLVYVSHATRGMTDEDLQAILAASRRNNAARNVGGLLLYHERAFMQVLEGESDDVDAVYRKIERDDRHTNARLLYRHEIEERDFPEWNMGFVPAEHYRRVPGFIEFFRAPERVLETLDGPSQVRRLLAQFRQGRWR